MFHVVSKHGRYVMMAHSVYYAVSNQFFQLNPVSTITFS